METKFRVKKREAVIPFDGEENFVVPKRGGFGQPDNANFVMVTGSTSKAPTTGTTPSNLPNDGSANTTTGTNVPITSAGEPIYNAPATNTTATEPTPTQPAPATPQQLCVAPNIWVNGACQTGGVEQSPAEISCIAGGGLWSGGINGTCTSGSSPKIIDTLPTFPVWSSLDCTTLKDKVAEYNALLSTSRFAPNVVEAYNTAIATAQGIYNTKCNVTPPAPAPIVLPPIGGGGFGGGGGGGFGEPPKDEVAPPVEEKKKSNMGIFLIIGGIGLLYLLTRKKKK